jgi:hypothetical protein
MVPEELVHREQEGSRVRVAQHLLQGVGLGKGKAAGSGTAEGGHAAPTAQSLSYVVAERADISTLGTEDPEAIGV